MASPCPGYKVTTPFGKKGKWAAGYHTGDDYAAPKGTRVNATQDGVVKHVGWGGYGKAYGAHIIIQHDDKVRTLYAHLSRTRVKVGQKVRAGDHIGDVGSTGNSTGPHLHYEERVSPYGYNNHRKPQFNRKTVLSPTYLSKLHVGQRNSESVKNLQRALNAHVPPLPGPKLPISGFFGPNTESKVRRCQKLRFGKSDPKGKTFVGIKQAAHLKLPMIRP